MGMAPCLNYITGNSSTPSSSCCSQLASIIQSQPQCLCSVLNGGGALLGITVNQTLAVALPGACSVQTPPVSQCNVGHPLRYTGYLKFFMYSFRHFKILNLLDFYLDSPPGLKLIGKWNLEPYFKNSGAGSETVPSTDWRSSDGGIMIHLSIL
ncbi:hypothetical protein PVL29_008415 [Vitis rotundifolia]|uniref:Bifunctional inhibitor/plant lipid transfer protein/seed storage helical domain-containing protein n=1 Tax=Vitis rotundifolia TaxID=103349 RepID=A0AA39DSW0_VITRO|nr:hypothetical protein PVL29_008415 [Vitis rotundifolia]